MTHSIKHSIRSVVEATGHQIRKTDVYSSQKLRYRRLFSLLNLNLILDVGANAGQFAQLCRTVDYRGKILSFEPSSTAYQKLLLAAASDPLWTVAGIALGSTTGETEINVSADSFCSSILPMLDSHLSAAPRSGYLHKEKVVIRRLDDVLPPPAFKSRTLLKLDQSDNKRHILGERPKTLVCDRIRIDRAFAARDNPFKLISVAMWANRPWIKHRLRACPAALDAQLSLCQTIPVRA